MTRRPTPKEAVRVHVYCTYCTIGRSLAVLPENMYVFLLPKSIPQFSHLAALCKSDSRFVSFLPSFPCPLLTDWLVGSKSNSFASLNIVLGHSTVLSLITKTFCTYYWLLIYLHNIYDATSWLALILKDFTLTQLSEENCNLFMGHPVVELNVSCNRRRQKDKLFSCLFSWPNYLTLSVCPTYVQWMTLNYLSTSRSSSFQIG